jgi:hypothetical protein
LNRHSQCGAATEAGTHTWHFELPLSLSDSGAPQWTLKAVAVDDQGRWASAWAESDRAATVQIAAQTR